jgi:hypothetical protein
LDAQSAVEDLQRRWAVTSCRTSILGRAEEILAKAERGKEEEGQRPEKGANPPRRELRVACRLAGVDYELVLTDEQAKLNVNRLLETTSKEEAQSAVGRLIRGVGGGLSQPVAVNLRPLAVGERSPVAKEVLRKLGAYGQVFDNASPADLAGDGQTAGLAEALTCWGDGKLNLRRALPEVIKEACRKALERKSVEALVAARDGNPYRDLSAILNGLPELDEKKKAELRKVFTDRSACHGLWVVARGRQRSWYTLVVEEGLIASPTVPATGPADRLGSAKATRPAAPRRTEFEW